MEGKLTMDKDVNLFKVVESGNIQTYMSSIENFDINITNQSGLSLLHKAIAHQRSEIAFDLVWRSINVNIQDSKGQSSLHYLAFFPDIALAKAIINNGAILDLKDHFGNTPLWYAVFNARGNYDYVELLIQNKANPNFLNNAGRSPIMFALQINDQRLIEILSR